jgi:hypothetical protein
MKGDARPRTRLTPELQTQQHVQGETTMPLLASAYDQSRFFKAADLKGEKKFRIKNVTPELVGTEAQKEKKLAVWFTNDERGLLLNKTNNRAIRGAYGDDTAGWFGKIMACFRRWWTCAAR